VFYGEFDVFAYEYGDVQLDQASAIIDGDDANDRLGYHLSGVGDVNCDGVEDFAVGANYADDVPEIIGGAVYIFLGPTPHSGNLAWQLPGSLAASEADVVIYGYQSGAGFGTALAGIGDVDEDGCDDLAVTAPTAIYSGTNQVGVVFLFRGSTTWGDGDPADPSLPLVFGSEDFDTAIHGANHGDRFGSSIASGDFDADGTVDLVVGARNFDPSGSLVDAGAAYVFFGGAGGVMASDGWWPALHQVDCHWLGTQANGHAGYSVLSGFDMDGDGVQDVAVGEPDWDGPTIGPGTEPDVGRVFVQHGASPSPCSGTESLAGADVVVQGTTKKNRFGLSLAAGNVDPGDATCGVCDDLVVGAPDTRMVSSYVAWIPGTPTLSGTQVAPAGGTLLYSPTATAFGWSVAVAEVSTLGGADIFVGAPYDSTNGTWAGAAHFWHGLTVDAWQGDGLSHATSTAWTTFYGEDTADYAGWSVSSLGDLNQDGEADLGVGAWGETYGIGSAYVLLSSY
jgi:hypothetical protein